MSHLPVQRKNETTPGRAVSRLPVGCQSAASSLKLYVQAKLRSIDNFQNGTCADHYHKTNNVAPHPCTPTGPTFRPSAPHAYQCLISHFEASSGACNLMLYIHVLIN